MKKLKHTAIALAAVTTVVVLGASSVATADVVRYSVDLENVDYFFPAIGDGQLILSVTNPAAAGGLVVDFGWDDLEIFVHDNTDQNAPFENWASELQIGYTWGEYEGIEYSAPFLGANSDGFHGPVSANNQHFFGDVINSDGTIELWARSIWDDGTGLPAGTLLSGTVWIDIQHQIPAPGVLAVLGLAGVIGCRRRRA
jgi:hypothetical protein